jgi:hypothetical protein
MAEDLEFKPKARTRLRTNAWEAETAQCKKVLCDRQKH